MSLTLKRAQSHRNRKLIAAFKIVCCATSTQLILISDNLIEAKLKQLTFCFRLLWLAIIVEVVADMETNKRIKNSIYIMTCLVAIAELIRSLKGKERNKCYWNYGNNTTQA